MVSFEIFVKIMPPSLSELKVLPSFCFAFKILDDVAASTNYLVSNVWGQNFHFLNMSCLQFVASILANMPSESNFLFAESFNIFVSIFMKNYKENLSRVYFCFITYASYIKNRQ